MTSRISWALNEIARLNELLDAGDINAEAYRVKLRAVLADLAAGERDAIDRHLAARDAVEPGERPKLGAAGIH
jgi:hypothetical protein